MAISERERLALYQRLQEQLGDESAGTLMELLPPAGWDDIATRDDVRATATLLRGEMSELRAELKGFRGEIRHDLATMQRTLVLWLVGFAASIWVTILAAGIVG